MPAVGNTPGESLHVKVLEPYTPFGEGFIRQHFPEEALVTDSLAKGHVGFGGHSEGLSVSPGPLKAQWRLFPRQKEHPLRVKPLSSSTDVDCEELWFQGPHLVWSCNRQLVRSYNFKDERQDVQGAFFARFPQDQTSSNAKYGHHAPWSNTFQAYLAQTSEEDAVRKDTSNVTEGHLRPALCVVLDEFIKIYFFDGEHYSVLLPFSTRRAWPAKSGLILQTKTDMGDATISSELDDALSSDPNIFTLSHPLREFSIVSRVDSLEEFANVNLVGAIQNAPSPFCDPQEEMIYVDDDCRDDQNGSFITFDRRERRVKLWRYIAKVDVDDVQGYDGYVSEPPLTPYLSDKSASIPTAEVPGSESEHGVKSAPIRRRTSSLFKSKDEGNPAFDRSMHVDLDMGSYGSPMQSSVFCYQFWTSPEAMSEPKHLHVYKVHGTHQEILCIQDKESRLLHFIDILDASVNRYWTVSSIFSAGVEATRLGKQDALILTNDGTWRLWDDAIDNLSCLVEIPELEPTGSSKTEKSRKGVVSTLGIARHAEVSVIAAIGNHLLLRHNGSIVHLSLNFVLRYQLVKACCDALLYALDSTQYFAFKRRFLTYHFSSISASDEAYNWEWRDFCITLYSFLSAKRQEENDGLPPNYTHPFHQLINSPLHRKIIPNTLAKAFKKMQDLSMISNDNSQSVVEILDSATKLSASHANETLFSPSTVRCILFALHTVYADFSIRPITAHAARSMLPVLLDLAERLQWHTWADLYCKHDPGLAMLETVKRVQSVGGYASESLHTIGNELGNIESPPNSSFEEAPTTFRRVYNMLRTHSWSDAVGLEDLRSILRGDTEHARVGTSDQTSDLAHLSKSMETIFRVICVDPCKHEEILKQLFRISFKLQDLEELPVGLGIPIRESLRHCRATVDCIVDSEWQDHLLLGRKDLTMQFAGDFDMAQQHFVHAEPENNGSVVRYADQDDGSVIGDTQVTDLLFGSDLRIKEVQKLLQSSKAVKIRFADRPEYTDAERTAKIQTQLRVLSNRTLALSIGKGMLTYSTCQMDPTRKLFIPDIVLSAKVLPLNTTVELTLHGHSPDYIDWPIFHAGVAAGLRIKPDSNVSGSWILYNKPSELDCHHAGFLLAMGLNGHLRRLPSVEWYKYLAQKHDIASIGLLLGLSAAFCGTSDGKVTRLLSIHIPALLPPNSTDLYHSSLTQTTCILGIGILYMSSAHRRMTELMLTEINRSDKTSNEAGNSHSEAYSLSAGMALGMIALGKGDVAGLHDLRIVDDLRVLMAGGPDATLALEHRQGTFQTRRTRMRESIDINITSPSAAIALGLMYLRTNKRHVAERIDIPDTAAVLNYIRPDFLFVRTLSRNLVLWDAIEPTTAWLNSQQPAFLLNAMYSYGKEAATAAMAQAFWNITAGSCFVLGLRFAGSANHTAFKLLLRCMDTAQESLNTLGTSPDSKVTKVAVKICFDVIMISIAMIMAGTGDLDALKRFRKVHGRINADTDYGDHMASHMAIGLLFLGGGTFTLGNSNQAIAALIAAFFPRFPSTPNENVSHLQAARHLWVLAVEPRCLIPRDVDTGRACYVPVIITVYADDEKKRLRERTTSSHLVIAPCLLPQLKLIKSIEVSGPRYWKMRLNLQDDVHARTYARSLLEKGCIYVQRKTGHLTYEDDPKGFRSIFARSIPGNISGPQHIFPSKVARDEFIISFSADPQILAFANHFCNPDSITELSRKFSAFCTSILYECLATDKPEAIEMYLSLYQCQQAVQQEADLLALWNLKLVIAYYSRLQEAELQTQTENPTQHLLQQGYVDSLKMQLEQTVQEGVMLTEVTTKLLSQIQGTPTSDALSFRSFASVCRTDMERKRLALYWDYFDIPDGVTLHRAVHNILTACKDDTTRVNASARLIMQDASHQAVELVTQLAMDVLNKGQS
ncbi:hypothetical protein BZG36_01280 [Bifiguratus adelaidae]|uniref:Uncharacterized protein n=1 Tax=Bifiguratus adelaidae TaxID=1938954 RepID=A0A261Y564_9FUNG|nr:hypothetical protein BZG36_01280 [Bifiguratus adelaidae]